MASIRSSWLRAAAVAFGVAGGVSGAGAADYTYVYSPPQSIGREPGARLASLISEAREALDQGRVTTAWRIADEAERLVPHSLDVRRLRADIERYERTALGSSTH